MAGFARATVERWIGEPDAAAVAAAGAGACCCGRLKRDTFGPPDGRRVYDRLAERRTVLHQVRGSATAPT